LWVRSPPFPLMDKVNLPNVAAVILLVFIALAVGSAFYNDYVKPDETDQLRQSVIQSCHRAQTRSALDQRFALEAAKARRRNAETLFDAGEPVKAQNEIATAKVYEDIAEGYAKITPVNCEQAYPSP